MKINLLILILLAPCICIAQIKDSELFGNELISKFIKLKENEGVLTASGAGGSLDHSNWKNKLFAVTFRVKSLPDLESARSLFLGTVNDLITLLNSTPQIGLHVTEYPVTMKSISIAILAPDESTLFSVSNCENEIIYRKQGLTTFSPSIEVHRETYERALEELIKNKTSCSKS